MLIGLSHKLGRHRGNQRTVVQCLQRDVAGRLLIEIQPLAVERGAILKQEPVRLEAVRFQISLHQHVLSLTFVSGNGRTREAAKRHVGHIQLACGRTSFRNEQIGRVAQRQVVDRPRIVPRHQDAHVEALDPDILQHTRATAHFVVHVDAHTGISCPAVLNIGRTGPDNAGILQRQPLVVVQQHAIP